MDHKQAIQILASRYQQIGQGKPEAKCSLLDSYQVEMPVLVKKYAEVEPTKSLPLTIPAIFNRSLNENFISDYLAYILNPQKNGIGSGPLKALLKLCAIDDIDVSLEKVIIQREYPLEEGRIDLLIMIGDRLVVGIENKILSPESTNQTRYYADVVNELFIGIPHSMIFLTRDGYKASSEEFIPVSYSMLLSIFKQIPVEHATEFRKLSLWEDFLEHLEMYIMNPDADHFEFSEKSKLYLEHFDMIDDLTKTFNNDWQEAISYIDTSLDERLTGGPWEHYFQTRYAWQQIWKSGWVTDELSIHFEWWLPLSDFRKGKLTFMIDVEGKQGDDALALFDSRIGEFKKIYLERGIAYRPKKRKNAIAYKEYSIEQNIDQIVNRFVESFEEFRFLEQVIDDVLAKLTTKE